MATLPNPVDLRNRGIAVLVRELGYVDAMRFLHQFGFGAGDYTTERHTFLPNLSAEEAVRQADELVRQRRV